MLCRQTPETDLLLFTMRRDAYIKEEAWESVPVAHPTLRGLRIAHHSLNEQCRSPRRYEINQCKHFITEVLAGYKHTTQTSTVALF